MARVDRSRITLAALELAAVAAECRHLEDVRHHLLPALVHATGGHLAVYHQISMPPNMQEFSLCWPEDPAWPAALVNYPTVIEHSPLLRHFGASTHPSIASIRELMTQREWHANAVYLESHRQLEVEDQLGVPLGMHGGRIHGITVSRCTGQFGASERTLLILISRHLTATLRRCLASGVPYRVLRVFPTPESVWVTGPAVVRRCDEPGLTAREREVLGLISAGLLAATIARQLDISPRTVEKHLENAYRKLRVTSRFDAAVALREEADSLGWAQR